MVEVITMVWNVLTAWCPRWTKVPPTHRLIKWSKCRPATEHGPGLIWVWPLVTDTEEVDVRWQSTVTAVQSLTMRDGTAVTCRVLAIWKVDDCVEAVGENSDYCDRAAEVSQSVVCDVMGSSTRDHLQTVAALNFAITVAIREELEAIGLEVDSCKFTELVAAPAFRIISD